MSTIEIESPVDLMVIPRDGKYYEIIDGQLKEKPVGAPEVYLANLIAFPINELAMARGLGVAVVEIPLKLDATSRSRYQPDLSYVSSVRWPRSRPIPESNAWAVVPDIAVEVVGPSNTALEIQGKVAIYLAAGVRIVWIVYPTMALAYIHEGPEAVRIVGRGGELDGGDVLPGFRLSMAELFPVEPE